MPKGNSVPCELCSSNIVVGLLYEFEPGIFICDECRDKLVKIEGFWFDGHAAEQSVHPTGSTVPPLVEFLANPENYPTAEQGSRPTTSG